MSRWEVVPMFLGTYRPRLDDKGRLFLPAKFRERLVEGLVITKGHDHCLSVYPTQEFTRLSTAMSGATSAGSRDVREYERFMFSGADAPALDKQGRVTIIPELRAYAQLERDCVAAGINNRFEIWQAEAWDRYLVEREESFSNRESEVLPGIL